MGHDGCAATPDRVRLSAMTVLGNFWVADEAAGRLINKTGT